MKLDVQGPGLELRHHLGESGVVVVTVRSEEDGVLGSAVFDLRNGRVVLQRAHDSLGPITRGERGR